MYILAATQSSKTNTKASLHTCTGRGHTNTHASLLFKTKKQKEPKSSSPKCRRPRGKGQSQAFLVPHLLQFLAVRKHKEILELLHFLVVQRCKSTCSLLVWSKRSPPAVAALSIIISTLELLLLLLLMAILGLKRTGCLAWSIPERFRNIIAANITRSE
jgi:hypothetical protein